MKTFNDLKKGDLVYLIDKDIIIKFLFIKLEGNCISLQDDDKNIITFSVFDTTKSHSMLYYGTYLFASINPYILNIIC